MIEKGTKCVIKTAPATFADMKGQKVTATEKEGATKTGAQLFDLMASGCGIYGNGNTGFVIEPESP